MKFIDKKNPRFRSIGLRINRNILNTHWDGSRYVNLSFEEVNKDEMTRLLVDEQDGYCCYCMRRLHLESDGIHRKNVTLEHVIPHKIKEVEWNVDRNKYRALSTLDSRDVAVCYSGELTDPAQRFGMPPFPHFIAYDNLVASCDGQTLNNDGAEINHHCCNNMRGNRYVEPLYFHPDVESEVKYDGRGHIVCDEEYIPQLQEEGVNIMSRFMNDVRLFWKCVAKSEYTAEQIHQAEVDENLRQQILDDIAPTDNYGRWFFLTDRKKWSIYSDYDWFFDYYINA